jgi:Protein of unknown function (DUF721).
MSALSLGDLLATQLPQALLAHANTLMRVQAALDRCLPPALVGSVRVAQLDAGNLHLACDSGAVAARLRHQTRALATELAQRGLVVDHVRVRVQPELLPIAPRVADKPGLPATALDSLAALNGDIDDGPLKQALARLLEHHLRPR